LGKHRSTIPGQIGENKQAYKQRPLVYESKQLPAQTIPVFQSIMI